MEKGVTHTKIKFYREYVYVSTHTVTLDEIFKTQLYAMADDIWLRYHQK